MDTEMIIVLTLLVVSAGFSIYSWQRNQGTGEGEPSLFDLALQLVLDAEETIKPREGESWDQANSRKLQYALDKLKAAHPEVNIIALRNIIEGAIDIFKRRVVTSNVARSVFIERD